MTIRQLLSDLRTYGRRGTKHELGLTALANMMFEEFSLLRKSTNLLALLFPVQAQALCYI